MSRRKTVLLVLVFVLLTVSELLTPMAVSMLIDRALNRAAPAETLGVVAKSIPGLAMCLGRFDSVEAGAAGAKIDGLRVQASHILLEDASLDMGALLGQGRLRVKQARRTEIVMKVTEQDLSAFIAAKVKEARNPSVKITADKVQIRSDIDLGIARLSLGVDGRIVADERSLRFVSDRLEVKNAGGINFGASFAEIPLVDLTKLPIPVGTPKVTAEPGLITIVAEHHG